MATFTLTSGEDTLVELLAPPLEGHQQASRPSNIAKFTAPLARAQARLSQALANSFAKVAAHVEGCYPVTVRKARGAQETLIADSLFLWRSVSGRQQSSEGEVLKADQKGIKEVSCVDPPSTLPVPNAARNIPGGSLAHRVAEQFQAGAAVLDRSARSAASNPKLRTSAASAAGGAVLVGAGGGAAGFAAGGFMGAAVGVVPALFTFGLSIPIGAAIGSGAGLCAGTAVGGFVGLVGGGTAGYGYATCRDSLAARSSSKAAAQHL